MDTKMDKTIATAVDSLYSLAIAFVVIGIFSAVVAHLIGGNTRRKRIATFNLVSTICFFIFFTVVFFPRLLGTGG